TDPGTQDTHTVVIDWGDGSAAQTLNLAAGVLSFSGVSHQYLDNRPGDAPYAVTALVTDNDGSAGSGSAAVAVANVAPADLALSLSAGSIAARVPYTTLFRSTDPGTQDTHTVVIDWGDGSAAQTLNLAAGVLTFSGVSHQYL